VLIGGDGMRTATKLLMGLALGGAAYGAISLLEPFVESLMGKKEKFQMPERAHDLSGDYNCEVEYKSTSGYFRKKYGDGFVKMPGTASVKFIRKGLKSYEMGYSGGAKSVTKTADLAVDGDTFKFTGTKEAKGMEYKGSKILDICKSPTEVEGEVKSDGIEFEQRIMPGDNANKQCEAENNEGTFTAKYKCKRITTKKECKDEHHRAVFIRPCAGQLFTDNSFTVTRVGGGTIRSVCQDLRDSCVTDIFIGFKTDHEGKCKDEKGAPLMVGVPLYPRLKSNEPVGLPKGSYKQGPDLTKDPIKDIISECEDMNIHAWVPIFHDPHAIKILGGSKEAGLKASSGSYAEYSDSFADPENESVIEYQLKILEEIAKKYQIMGINLDYIRYSDELPGKDPKTKQQLFWSVKSDAINSFVQKAAQRLAGVNASIVLSADVMASEGARIAYGQQGVPAAVDVIMPMSYSRFYTISTWLPGLEENPELSRQAETAELKANLEVLKLANSERYLLPIMRGWIIKQTSEEFLSDLKADTSAAMEVTTTGYALFTYESLLSETGSDSLNQLVQSDKVEK
jgi:hypothetical protein